MDPRTVGHTLDQISDLLELKGEDRYRTAAYRNAARAITDLDTDDLAPLLRSGELSRVRGLGPATLAVVQDMVQTGESSYLERLRAETPEGLLELLRVPGLGTAKIHQIHGALGITSLDELEEAARDGRLARLPRFGSKTAEKILGGIEQRRQAVGLSLYPRARTEAMRLLAALTQHPGVAEAAIAGEVRRHAEVVGALDLVCACRDTPAAVVGSFSAIPGVRQATTERADASCAVATVRFVDGIVCRLTATAPDQFALALWRTTGSGEHAREVEARATERGLRLSAHTLADRNGVGIPIESEVDLYAAVGLSYIEPELREGRGEIAAAQGHLPSLVSLTDIRGILHAHTTFSDGTATVAEMAIAAMERGWSYLGITDHSPAAFYAGGLSAEGLIRQHAEIDRVNAAMPGMRILKGAEADILVDGRIDYEESILDRFDFVVASIHSRFNLDRQAMTARVLRALDDPHVTVLGHPTGRLLLGRPSYDMDVQAVLEKAAALGVAIELNADPRRLDLDWRWCQVAKQLGCVIEIGPDAHSVNGLDVVAIGVGIARKGWLEPGDVLNARTADDVLAFARARRGAVS